MVKIIKMKIPLGSWKLYTKRNIHKWDLQNKRCAKYTLEKRVHPTDRQRRGPGDPLLQTLFASFILMHKKQMWTAQCCLRICFRALLKLQLNYVILLQHRSPIGQWSLYRYISLAMVTVYYSKAAQIDWILGLKHDRIVARQIRPTLPDSSKKVESSMTN